MQFGKIEDEVYGAPRITAKLGRAWHQNQQKDRGKTHESYGD